MQFRRTTRVLAGLSLLASFATSQTLTWKELAPASAPSARTKHRLSHAFQTRKTVLFGGISSTGQTLNETWEWNGSNWTKLAPATSPLGRWQHVMNYDFFRRVHVVFSGWSGSMYHNDTWEFDGTNWKDVSPTTQPIPRDHHAMAFDFGRRRMVMFGGWSFSMNRTLFNDTWEWDGTTWTQITTTGAPDTRDGHAMAFDLQRNVTVLFGGGRERPQNRAVRGDTWTYDGATKTWTKQNPTKSPLPRFNHRMTYDRGRNVVVLFGGRDATKTFNDVWEWNGTNWTQITTASSPSPRQYADMIYDTSTQRCLVFGGDLNSGNGAGSNDETWLYGLFTPSAYDTFGAGCPSGSQGCNPCATRNFSKTLAAATTSATKIGCLEAPTSTLNVCGADLYCSAKSGTVDVTIAIHDFDNTNAVPGKLLRSGKVKINTTAGVYGVTFPPVRVSGIYIVAFDNADKLNLPVSPTGSSVPHYELTTSWGQLKSDTRWQYVVRCDTGNVVPLLSNTGAPMIGQTFNVDLSAAPANRAAVMFFGFSDKTWGPFTLPLDLNSVAPGCKLFVSGELLFGQLTDAQGNASLPIALPNDPALIKGQLFQQFLVADPSTNPLGAIFTRGGRATLGDS